MNQNPIAGVTVSVVRDGQLFFAKGYGYADVARQIPVDPETTLFRIGSISKIFIWTAVMQLAEQGKIDLNADVNTYLDFKIPATYPQPITMIHLMAHTPGFEDLSFGMGAATPDKITPLSQWLAAHIPARVRPPGEFSSYSNYGAALAGYIVERLSGMPFDDYVDRNILQPLGMAHTTSRQPLPANLGASMSKGYKYASGAFDPKPFDLIIVAPAGSISATAADMARFMIAHLQYGAYGEARILQEATARQMQSRLFGHDPRLNGWAYGFYEMSQNGQRVIGHGGDINAFHSLMALLPEQNLGLFISYNSVAGAGMSDELFHEFMDRYYPALAENPTPMADAAKQAKRCAGTYQVMRRSYTTFEKVTGLMGAPTVRATKDGALVIDSPAGGARYVEVEPLVFQKVGGQEKLIFREDAHGNVKYVFLDSAPETAIEKLQWYEVPMFHYVLLGVCLLLFLTVIITAPVAFFVRRRYQDKAPQPRLARIARWLLGILSLLVFLFLAGEVAAFSNNDALVNGDAAMLKVTGGAAILLAALTVVAVLFAVLAWVRRYWGLLGRIHYTLVTLAAVGLIWFLNFWNLLGWRF
jgi:CubicO group peptidase (beta-lactamase class C family)